MIKIVNYEQKYEQEVVDLWNTCCTFDPINVAKFRRQVLFDENFDPNLCYIALENKQIIGCVLAMKRQYPYLDRGLEPERGWITALFIDPNHRRQKIATELCHQVESNLKNLGCKNITLGAYSPNYFFAGVDPVNYCAAQKFFESIGYVGGDTHYSMGRNLHGYRIPEKSLEKKKKVETIGYKFLNFEYLYAIELLEFLGKEFGGGWKRNALLAMQKEIAKDVILIALDPSGSICGFCMRAIDGNPMRFGPIGVAESARNAGLGGILLDMQMYEMCKHGLYRMYFVTTDEPGKRYYERHGLSDIRTFIDYRKNIK